MVILRSTQASAPKSILRLSLKALLAMAKLVNFCLLPRKKRGLGQVMMSSLAVKLLTYLGQKSKALIITGTNTATIDTFARSDASLNKS
jgi:hypothetical protein